MVRWDDVPVQRCPVQSRGTCWRMHPTVARGVSAPRPYDLRRDTRGDRGRRRPFIRNGGSSTAPSPIVWRKPVTASSTFARFLPPSAMEEQPAPPTPSSGCMRSSAQDQDTDRPRCPWQPQRPRRSRTLRTNQGGLSGCGNPAPASGARVQAVPYPGQAMRVQTMRIVRQCRWRRRSSRR